MWTCEHADCRHLITKAPIWHRELQASLLSWLGARNRLSSWFSLTLENMIIIVWLSVTGKPPCVWLWTRLLHHDMCGMHQTLLHIVVCNLFANWWSGSLGFKRHHENIFYLFPLLCSSVESTQRPGMKAASHERDERERTDETGSTDEIFTTEEVHSWAETLPCLLLCAFFLTWHRGTWFPLCCPIHAISEGEVITQGRRNVLHPLLSASPPPGNPATFWSA